MLIHCTDGQDGLHWTKMQKNLVKTRTNESVSYVKDASLKLTYVEALLFLEITENGTERNPQQAVRCACNIICENDKGYFIQTGRSQATRLQELCHSLRPSTVTIQTG